MLIRTSENGATSAAEAAVAAESATYNADANELGVYRRIGSIVTAGYSFPEHWARRIRSELDPYFRELWSNVLWMSPNGGLVWTGHHVLARYVPNPRADHEVLSNLLLPSGRVHGVEFRNPLVIADVLDGLTDEERNKGVLPRYEPFDQRRFEQMRWASWRLRNLTFNGRAWAAHYERRDNEEARAARQKRRLGAALKTDRSRLKQSFGLADRVFVSDTLRKAVEPMEGVPA